MMRAIVLVDHGSRHAAANQTLLEVAELVRAEVGSDWFVVAAHMEIEPPAVADAIAECVSRGAREIVVQPYFLALGRHAAEDIPRLVAEVARTHPGVSFRVAEPLGTHTLLAKLVALRCGAAKESP
jgi:sirohydrochlorin cobaltochelatase